MTSWPQTWHLEMAHSTSRSNLLLGMLSPAPKLSQPIRWSMLRFAPSWSQVPFPGLWRVISSIVSFFILVLWTDGCVLTKIAVNDTQEIDWEILTSTVSTSSACVPSGIWATNQVYILPPVRNILIDAPNYHIRFEGCHSRATFNTWHCGIVFRPIRRFPWYVHSKPPRI